MNRYIRKMLFRSIRSSLGRYVAILAIVALGVGFYAGLKCSMPAMLATADDYLRAQRLPDFRLLSTLGFTAEDARAFEELNGVEAAEGAFFADAEAGLNGENTVWHFMSLTEKVGVPHLTAGRWPTAPGECLGDERNFSESDIGRTLTLSADNEQDTLDLFSRKSYTLVGLAKSPRFISRERGSTSIGSGRIGGFVILPKSGFTGSVYHELLLWCAFPGVIYSEEYNASRDRMADDVKALLNRRGTQRRSDLLSLAEKELEKGELRLDEGWEQLAEARQEVAEKLADARKALDDARKELDDGWAEVKANQRQLNKAMEMIPSARQEIAKGRGDIAASRQKIADGYRQIAEGRAEIERRRAEAAEGQAQIDAGWEELRGNEAQVQQFRELFNTAKATLREREQELRELLQSNEAAKYAALAPYYEAVLTAEGEVYLLRTRIEAVEGGQGNADELPELRRQLSEAESRLSSARDRLTQAENSYDPNTAQVVETEQIIAALYSRADELEAQLRQAEKELADGRAKLRSAQAELNAGIKKIDAAEVELGKKEGELKAGEKKLDAAEKQLNEAEAQLDQLERDYPGNQKKLDDARAKLNDGEAELADGWKDYEEGKAEAEQELADGEDKLRDGAAELLDARGELDDKLRLEVYTMDRSANAGYVTFENDTKIIDAIANAFPIFFAMIAALVCVTTMTRMVNDERTLIGTMKAMGYSSGAIMSKYLCYAGSSALFGCVGGFFLGTTVIPRIIYLVYSIMYSYSDLEFYFDPWMYAACLFIAVPGALWVTWLACRRELGGKPAELMRPKAPGSGKRILLENIRFLWDRMPFLSKVTLRNAFRHRQRVAMMLLGIGGCTALLVAGYGARDSVANIANNQYEEIFLYDLAVTLDTDTLAADAEAARLWQGETQAAALTWQEAVTVIADGREKDARVTAAPGDELTQVISLHNDAGSIPFPGPGEAVVTSKLADRLGLTAGSRASLRLDDGSRVEFTVTAVCDNYLKHYVYVCPETVGSPRNNTALLRVPPEADAEALAARLRSEKGVTYVSSTARERETMEQSMSSMDLIVVMLIVCSGALAFITLYNLTNINIMERTREIATVKVLGFFPNETAAYILRENILLSFLGDVAGMGMGKLLHRFVMELLDVEYMQCDMRVKPASYLWSFLITLVFAALTNAFMRFKLEKVDMAESLKSVE